MKYAEGRWPAFIGLDHRLAACISTESAMHHCSRDCLLIESNAYGHRSLGDRILDVEYSTNDVDVNASSASSLSFFQHQVFLYSQLALV